MPPALSERLRLLRQLFGYSQEYVAITIGMTQPAYCKWESGQTRPALDKLQQLAALYQLNIGELLNENELELVKKISTDNRFVEKLLGRKPTG